eukprot:COSAG02_NODE_4_length_69935_cov_46.806590_12_plen_83_part_00
MERIGVGVLSLTRTWPQLSRHRDAGVAANGVSDEGLARVLINSRFIPVLVVGQFLGREWGSCLRSMAVACNSSVISARPISI